MNARISTVVDTPELRWGCLCSTRQADYTAPRRAERRRGEVSTPSVQPRPGVEPSRTSRDHGETDTRSGWRNGTEEITLALRGDGVGQGDEVVVPSFSSSLSEPSPRTGPRRYLRNRSGDDCITADTVRDGDQAADACGISRAHVRLHGPHRRARGI